MMSKLRIRTVLRPRFRLRAGCAAAALAAMTGPWASAASAQAFNGTPTVAAGAVNFDRTTPGVETITVLDDAIVNWAPVEAPDGSIDFLPAGNTATFQDSPGDGGFIILNRVLPTGNGIVQLNGNIISQLQTGAGNVSGGTVAFYSPTGILVGSTAAFDVGSLILTAADPDPLSFQEFGAGSGALSLATAPGSQARVEVEAGATIGSTAENRFLALVAPQVIMNGDVRVNGSTAYVAAEAVDVTLVNGLFDIVVTVGTSVTDAIIHGGSTGGPSRTGSDANQAIYAVGVGQAQAVRLAFSGDLGFDPATDASIVNGEIILSAGSSVIDRGFVIEPGAAPADLFVGNATVTSDFSGSATREAILLADGNGDLVFEQDVAVRGTTTAGLFANGGDMLVVGDAKISADAAGMDVGTTGNPALADATGGVARILAENGGSLTVQGDATVTANANGGDGPDGGDAVAGSAGLIALGGEIQIDGAIVATADAVGGDASVGFGGRGGNAEGGTAFVQAQSPGIGRLIGNVATITVNATGGAGGAGNSSIAAGAGGEGRAGLYDGVLDSGGAFMLAGREQGNVALTSVTLEAVGTGGAGGTGATGQAGGAGGAAFGGTTQLGSFTGDATSSLVGSVSQFTTAVADSSAIGGAGGAGPAGAGAGGDASAGVAYVTATSGGLVIGNDVDLISNAQGGAGGTGGAATGLQAGLSTVGAIEIVDVTIQTRTLGGAGSDGSTGTATGGNLLVETAAGVFGSVGTVLVESLNGDITTQGDAATSTPGTADLLVPVGTALFTHFQVDSTEATPGQLAPAASQFSTGGLVTFLELAQLRVQGDIEIATTGSGRILGGPDPSTPTATLNFISGNGTISIAGADDGIINLGGQTLQLFSSDLEIMEGARIGGVSVSLLANDTGEVVTLGGGEQGPGYTLTQAEAARIEAGSVFFGGGDVVVRDLTISGSPDDGPSFVELEADNVSVQGALVYLAGPDDTLSIDVGGDEGGGLLEVITPTGSISVNDGETLAGRLEIEAETTIVADAELTERIKADPDFEGLAEALATNNGPDNPEGYLQASIIEFSFDGEVGESQKAVFIQNSGNDTTFGGVATRAPGLVFALEDDDDEAAQVRLIGYGAGLDEAGNVVTNSDYFNAVDFGVAQGITYADDSEFNAFFVNTGLPARPGVGQLEGGAIVGSEIVAGPLAQVVTPETAEEERDVAFGGAFPGLINAAELTLDSMIDQPVASGGDSAQWRGGNDEDEEDEDESEDSNGDGQEP